MYKMTQNILGSCLQERFSSHISCHLQSQFLLVGTRIDLVSVSVWQISSTVLHNIQHLSFMNFTENTTGQLVFCDNFIRGEHIFLQECFFSNGHII